MTVTPDVVSIFTTDPDAPLGNAVPTVARLLIDAARRQKLTNENRPMMLNGIGFGSFPWFDPAGVTHG
jgi:hypothetical protein